VAFAHANLELGEGALGWVVNLPPLHAVHHSSALDQSRSNFGCHTVVWDRLFGTFRRPSESSAPIGVEPLGPRTLWQELAWPLYRWVSPADPPRTKSAAVL
jgi:lathosterol oxidase